MNRCLLRFYFLLLSICASGAAGSATPSITLSKAANVDGSSAFAIDRTGRLYGWGSDVYGQLGQGRLTSSSAAVLVGDGFSSVSVGNAYVMAIKADGSLWGWGQNSYGQLGDGTVDSHSAPVRIGSDYRSVVAAYAFTMAIKGDGTLWIWGQGTFGDGSAVTSSRRPTLVGSGYAAVATGGFHVLALKTDGSLWAWGSNSNGQLGIAASDTCNPGTNSTFPCSFTKQLVGTGYVAIAAGKASSYAIKSDGSLWAWGQNQYGQLGDGSTIQRNAPVLVGYGFTSVAAEEYGADYSHVAAVKSDGSLWAWGSNVAGALGDGTGVSRDGPVKIGDGFSTADVGGMSTFAVRTDGTLLAAGFNVMGMFGDGRTDASPVLRQIASNVASVSAGWSVAAHVNRDGKLWIAGDNSFGQLGIGSPIARSVPVFIGADYATVATGGFQSTTLATKTDGSLWAWGNNSLGASFGDNSPSTATPRRIGTDSDYAGVSAGWQHFLALKTNGNLFGWGSNYLGALGLGPSDPTVSIVTPRLIGTGYSAVSAGQTHSAALRADGTLWTWGMNASGQLGVATAEVCGAYPCATTPQLVGTGFRSISAGDGYTMAIKLDGTLWAWGANDSGQLGVATTETCTPANTISCSRSPKLVGSGFATVAAGSSHTLAAKADGSLWAWGANYWGELGYGEGGGTRVAPRRIDSGFTNVAAGGFSSFGIRSDGSLYSWGQNFFGLLGDGTLANRFAPVVVLRENGAGSVAGNDWFLNLEPGAATTIPSANVPAFLIVASGTPTNATADLRFRAQDVGTTASIYVFALAPASAVKSGAAPNSRGEDRAADSPVPCVLAQLNSAGELQHVSTSTLQAYATGVLGAQGQSVTILDNAAAANVAGATFYVGYGSSASSMIGSGLNRSAVTVPGTVACSPQRPQTGWWWNPLEGGRGYSIETQGNHIFFAAFHYDVSGRAMWNVSSGVTSLDGSLFTGDLLNVTGGQTLGGPYNGFPHTSSLGALTLAFNDASHGTMIWPGGTVPIERMNLVTGGLLADPQPDQPEAGWWWNQQESGRGFFIEWQKGYADVAGYMYDEQGNPIWYIAVYPTPDAHTFTGSWWQYANGQSMSGPYKPATQISANVAPVTITFSGPDTALMTLPNGRTTALKRQRF